MIDLGPPNGVGWPRACLEITGIPTGAVSSDCMSLSSVESLIPSVPLHAGRNRNLTVYAFFPLCGKGRGGIKSLHPKDTCVFMQSSVQHFQASEADLRPCFFVCVFEFSSSAIPPTQSDTPHPHRPPPPAPPPPAVSPERKHFPPFRWAPRRTSTVRPGWGRSWSFPGV